MSSLTVCHVNVLSHQTRIISAAQKLFPSSSVMCCSFKVKLSLKFNWDFFCIWVKPSCKTIITMKEALLRFTVFLFLGNSFSVGALRALYNSIKVSTFKSLRSLDTTWNFACSITRVCTHEHSSTGPHTLDPDVSISKYFSAAMTTASGTSYC